MHVVLVQDFNTMPFRFEDAKYFLLGFLSIFAMAAGGCSIDSQQDADSSVKPPKPVSTMVLKSRSPSFQHHTTASVAPWKAERIGFEQAGRVVQVIEPNEMVRGRGIGDAGDVLARLDDEAFRIAVDAAKADAAVAERRRDSNRIAIEQRLPTLIRVAEAEQKLADTEFARIDRLMQLNASSGSELDTTRTRASTASLRVAAAKADLAQALAEQLALDAQFQQANQKLAEAERNLKNTVLFSSFPGQVSEIHAVPGTYVREGDPIATVLMVDPMLVEFEVTGADSRRYQRGDVLGVSLETPEGKQQSLTGMVYTVDTIADINTRTFTVTLHVRNQPERDLRKPGSSDVVATTDIMFPLNLGPIVTGDERLLVEQRAIHRIGDENFVWKITNRSWNKLSNVSNRELTVERLKVEITSEAIPFLGSWNFVAIEFEDASQVNPAQDLITGKLSLEGESPSQTIELKDWKDNRVFLQQTRWMLRAGDTVRVELLPESSSQGFYVPMKAVRRENGKTFVHVVAESEGEKKAQRLMVNVTSDDTVSGENLMLRIEPVTAGQLKDGSQIVVGGTHYLDDGDPVRVVPTQRTSEGGR